MAYNAPVPPQVPEPGYYYHYKHDPAKDVNNYAYYILGVGLHTEDDCREQDQFMMVYQPLYDAHVYRNGKMFDLRPLDMFYQPAEWQGLHVERFKRITDPLVIARLRTIKRQMYPPHLEE